MTDYVPTADDEREAVLSAIHLYRAYRCSQLNEFRAATCAGRFVGTELARELVHGWGTERTQWRLARTALILDGWYELAMRHQSRRYAHASAV